MQANETSQGHAGGLQAKIEVLYSLVREVAGRVRGTSPCIQRSYFKSLLISALHIGCKQSCLSCGPPSFHYARTDSLSVFLEAFRLDPEDDLHVLKVVKQAVRLSYSLPGRPQCKVGAKGRGRSWKVCCTQTKVV